MIRLINVNKYYNRHKSNQIHVINNTSLELPESGIVTLLGPSGCGKTTLLNCIGGLDKISSGKIYIDNQKINKKRTGKKDKIRNAKIGYIFQNFNLLDEETVFENVAIALRMIGIRKKNLVKERVHYCLKQVGIYAYRNKPAGALSGGQRQRVAIARAIVKNPRIIIADEPTGNLDSGNTLAIMNIIKKISQDRLVLLVTHEENIAKFYSNRIIRLKDGAVVSDEEVASNQVLDYQLDNKIYLKDMAIHKELQQGGMGVSLYADQVTPGEIRLAIRGGNIFIDTGGKYNIIDETNDIELIDDHYSAIDSSVFESSNFDYNAHMPAKYRVRYRSIIGPVRALIRGFKTIGNFRVLRKLLLVGFVLAAMFSFYAASHIVGMLNVERADFLKTNDHYVTVGNPGKNMKLVKKIQELDSAKYVIPGNSTVTFTMPMDDYYQTSNLGGIISGSLVDADVLEEEQLFRGTLPEKSHDVVVDKMILKSFLETKVGTSVGITKYKDFIGRKLKVNNLSFYTITGISEVGSPSIFVKNTQFIDLIANAEEGVDITESGGSTYYDQLEDTVEAEAQNYSLHKKNLTIKKGTEPKEDYDVIVSVDHEDEYKLDKTIERKVNGKKLKVVGFYESKVADDDGYYVTQHTIELSNYGNHNQVTVYAEDPWLLNNELDDAELSGSVNYDRERTSYMKSIEGSLRSSLILAGVILLISLIEIFLMLRSSFLSRIREIGTYRAIGVKKKDIYRMFAGEIVAISLLTSAIGIGLMYYILYHITQISSYYKGIYMVKPWVALATFGVLLVFDLLIGLIPVFRVMRKTPAQILARTDI